MSSQPYNGGQPGLQHEMSNYSQSSNYDHAGAPAVPNSSTIVSLQDFLARVDFAKSEIRALTSSIQEIASLHQRALSSPDSSSSAQLEGLVTSTQLKNTQIKDHIKYLQGDAAKTQDGSKSTKVKQAEQLKKDFERALGDYQQEEVAYKQRYKEQIARQYRIVNPDATEAEVQEASELDWGSEGVFQTAVSFPPPLFIELIVAIRILQRIPRHARPHNVSPPLLSTITRAMYLHLY